MISKCNSEWWFMWDLSAPRAKLQTFGGSGHFFPGWSVGNWTCLQVEIGSRQPPQYDRYWGIFHPWNILKIFSGSVAAHYAGGPVELLCITAETIYYRNAPSIFRVSMRDSGVNSNDLLSKLVRKIQVWGFRSCHAFAMGHYQDSLPPHNQVHKTYRKREQYKAW